MKQYGSKREIYRDYDIAIKLITDGPVRSDYYDRLLDAFYWDDAAMITQMQERVSGWEEGAYGAVGFFVEVAERGDSGDPLGTRFILLEHETGPEFFIEFATDPTTIHGMLLVATFVVNKAFDALYSKIQESALRKIGQEAYPLWQQVKGGARISAVEIRTENRGVGRLRFSAFRLDQIECLLNCFKSDQRAHLFDCNQQCFDGQLVEASGDEER